jgi:ceramide glucosyltransferase
MIELLFYVLLVEQILQGLYSLWQGIAWLRMARRHAGQPAGFYTPRVAVICPVKGLEAGLEENLTALANFDYAQYDLFLSIASAEDPAYKILERFAAKTKRQVHIVRAGPPKDCGEKVNNLRVAVDQVGQEFEVLVFVDSDGLPPRRWLARMVAPLADARAGAATTFRWLLPRRGGFWSALASAWNASIVTFLGEHDRNFCWGGGVAIRRDRFDDAHVMEAWNGSVSDDYSMTLALARAGHPIAFVPECLVASPVDLGASDFFEFTNRQLIITRVYSPKLWLTAALGHLFYCAVVLLGLGLFVGNWAAGLPSFQIILLALFPVILCAGRGVLRLAAVLDLLPEWREKLLTYGWAWTLLAPLVPFVYLCNTIVAAFSRTITWRGIRYQLISPRQTHILSR